MKKLFISQPMNGLTKETILSERTRAHAEAERQLGEPLEVLETFFEEGWTQPLLFIGASITKMAEADVIFFVRGWENARGCRIEYMCTEEYSLNRIRIEE